MGRWLRGILHSEIPTQSLMVYGECLCGGGSGNGHILGGVKLRFNEWNDLRLMSGCTHNIMSS